MERVNKEAYLQDPCGASSLPYWKTNCIPVPENLLILREDDPRLDELCKACADTPYFKLIHRMQRVDPITLPKGFRFVLPDEAALCEHIAACYKSERVSASELAACRLRPTFSPDLWLAIIDEATDEIVASGIGEVDGEIREGILEWIQVSPACRRQGFGRIIVCELLLRMQGRVDFVTVSGKETDPFHPRTLYEGCGFGGGVVWHVLQKTRRT